MIGRRREKARLVSSEILKEILLRAETFLQVMEKSGLHPLGNDTLK